MIKVFYDGKCGLCSKEIAYYRRIAPNGIFDWHDITASAVELEKEGITLAECLKILHVIDREKRIHKGVDAFISIWSELKYWKPLARLVSYPVVKPVANMMYTCFANWRFNKLEHCQIALKRDSEGS